MENESIFWHQSIRLGSSISHFNDYADDVGDKDERNSNNSYSLLIALEIEIDLRLKSEIELQRIDDVALVWFG